ncbi:undecaprenyl diphosphate synthase family protein [Defluviitalea phaphyphila]|uniref:undecaprenyl diphosphate synthase family protein n=1 Tax=Defluviitalea phaphyphila TaxID=1473580 RepID=UPI0007306173|nr:undecaprenyl diphosphate synthase family protein [Defluviitalea phaphyphila]
MQITKFKRLPKHIGIIPDGNRRWAVSHNKEKHEGYNYGIAPGFELYNLCLKHGIKELTFYGFTQDNTKRPAIQTKAFQKACVDAVMKLANRDANLLVIGNHTSPLFPKELLPFANKRVRFGKGLININFLVNYGWKWDLSTNASKNIPRIDLIIRWGGRRRLSGFLPIQSVYADFYIIDDFWPDFKENHLYEALSWYQTQDITLGG